MSVVSMCTFRLNLVVLAASWFSLHSCTGQSWQGVNVVSKADQAVCIVTGEAMKSGVAWDASANETRSSPKHAIPLYRPQIMESHLECSFETNCRQRWNKNLWKVGNSFDVRLAPRTDSGWNEIPTLHSKARTFGELDYNNKADIGADKPQFVSISMKVARDAHVVFCYSYYFLSSSCYMILISAFGGSLTTVRKCIKGMPVEYAIEPSCQILRQNATAEEPLVDDRKWRHFLFSINQTREMTELKLYANGNDSDRYDEILVYQDHDNPIPIYYFGVRSYKENALWKIHDYNFLYTKSIMTNGTLYINSGRSSFFDYKEEQFCLRMSVALCLTCTFQLHVEESGGRAWLNSHVVYGKDRSTGSNNGLLHWKEELFNIPLGKPKRRKTVKLRFSTLNTDGDTRSQFWAIDSVKECTPNDEKILKFLENYKGEDCEILDEHMNRISKDRYRGENVIKDPPDCSHWYSSWKSCRGIKINSNKCYPGFNGADCYEFTTLEAEFKIINSKYTNFEFEPRSLDPTGSVANYMTIQYQYKFGDEAWESIGERRGYLEYKTKLSIPKEYSRRAFIRGQKLFVRAILLVDAYSDYEVRVPGMELEMTCNQPNEIEFYAESHSIQITWKIKDSECPINYYTIYITSKGIRCDVLDQNECIFRQLEASTEFNISFGRSDSEYFTKTFSTLDEVPGPVLELESYSAESDSISLRWKPPAKQPEKVLYYTIRYQDSSQTKGTFGRNSTGVTCSLWPDCICYTINNVEEAKYYTIQILVYNRNPRPSTASTITAITQQSQSSEPEQLKLANADLLEITWRHPYYPYGAIEYFDIFCELRISSLRDEPLHNTTATYKFNVEEDKAEYSYRLTGLHSASTYHVIVTPHNKYIGQSSSVTVSTPPDQPDVMETALDVEKVSNERMSIKVPEGGKAITKQSGVYIIVVEYKPILLVDSKRTAYAKFREKYVEVWKTTMLEESEETIAWLAKDLSEIPREPQDVIIGTGISKGDTWDAPLNPESTYTIAAVYYNQFENKKAYTVRFNNNIHEKYFNNYLWGFMLLALVPIIGYVIYRKYCVNSKEPASDNIMIADMRSKVKSFFPLRGVSDQPTSCDSPQITARLVPNPVVTVKKPVDANQVPPVEKARSAVDAISRPVDVADFENYVKEALSNGELDSQHKIFKRGLLHNVTCGIKKENKKKNRYLNMIAYDSTRVILQKLPHDPCSDYINANFIDGYERPKEYIAAQGPKENTTNDFWRMVWQEKVSVICMLTNVKELGKEKCHQYWPVVEGTEEQYGDITVRHISSTIYADYVFRTFNINCGTSNYMMEHLHFTAWPDHGVPLYPQSVVSYINKMQEIQSHQGPTIVHCSAGVGRTGTIILADICLKMARKVDKIDVLFYQNKIRQQRANLVDNNDQYKLVHMIIVESLFGEPSGIPCNVLKSQVCEMRQNNTLLDKWRNLDQHTWKDNFLKSPNMKPEENEENKEKNRNDIIPAIGRRVFLSRFPLSDENSDYINAVYVDGFHAKDQFIVTQFPLANTIADYWRMVSDKEITLVAVLNEIDLNDKTIHRFVPDATVEIISPIPEISVCFKQEKETEYCRITTVQLQNNVKEKEPISRTVTVVRLKDWQARDNLPTNASRGAECLLTLWEQLEKLATGTEPILMTCYDGATACGLFTALTFVIEKIKLQSECDVPLAIRTIRRNRKEMLRSEEQFNFLYDAALKFLDDFEIYSNFQ